jgi:hypothetical protein
MLKGIYLPLQGPHGVRPKAPAVGAWQSPGYAGFTGVQAEAKASDDEWYGLRCDGLVVVDCDDAAAAMHWCGIDTEWDRGRVRKTPRGYHFVYKYTEGSPTAPAVGVFEHTDIRAGATSQIVYFAPGYYDRNMAEPRYFDPRWLPDNFGVQVTHDDEAWSEMPDGRGNNTMAAFAGAFRKQGMDVVTIVKCLSAINRITMTRDPMTQAEVIEIAKSVGRYAARPDIDIELDEDD